MQPFELLNQFLNITSRIRSSFVVYHCISRTEHSFIFILNYVLKFLYLSHYDAALLASRMGSNLISKTPFFFQYKLPMIYCMLAIVVFNFCLEDLVCLYSIDYCLDSGLSFITSHDFVQNFFFHIVLGNNYQTTVQLRCFVRNYERFLNLKGTQFVIIQAFTISYKQFLKLVEIYLKLLSLLTICYLIFFIHSLDQQVIVNNQNPTTLWLVVFICPSFI